MRKAHMVTSTPKLAGVSSLSCKQTNSESAPSEKVSMSHQSTATLIIRSRIVEAYYTMQAKLYSVNVTDDFSTGTLLALVSANRTK